MDCSIKTIAEFYKTSLGEIVQFYVSDLVDNYIKDNLNHQTVLGIGYTHPYLKEDLFLKNSVFSFMPETIGALSWPNTPPYKTALIHDWLLPLPNQCVDYLLLVHCVEFLTQPSAFFDEIWRILKKDGKVIMIVPNRRGIWARFDHTPFGFGHPYTMTQAINFLSNNGFVTIDKKRLLFFPPTQSIVCQSFSGPMEFFGPLCFQKFSGLNAIFAEKKTLVLSGTKVTQSSKELKKCKPILSSN